MRTIELITLLGVIACLFGGHHKVDARGEVSVSSFQKDLNQSLLWGPYRSNCYFGIRPRYVDESPLISGLFWFESASSSVVKNAGQFQESFLKNIRHFVDQGDNLDKYNWELYDARLGGRQVLVDSTNNVNLTISFAKSADGLNWGYKVRGTPLRKTRRPTSLSVVLYMNQISEDENLSVLNRNFLEEQSVRKHQSNKMVFNGASSELGLYDIEMYDVEGVYHNTLGNAKAFPQVDTSRPIHISMNVPEEETWKVKDVFQTMISDALAKYVESLGDASIEIDMAAIHSLTNVYGFNEGNFHFVQKTFDLSKPFEFDVIYNSHHSSMKIESGEGFQELLAENLRRIESQFEKQIVSLREHGANYSDSEQEFAKETFFNLFGGLGYFHGDQVVDRYTELDDTSFQDMEWKNAEHEGPHSLFSLVPSRAFFPRGFYWDEGFHLLQLSEYDFDLTLEVFQSWFNQVDDETGWIAREIMLGEEARHRVPQEFQTQSPQVANPPTLLLALGELLTKDAASNVNELTEDTPESDELKTKHAKLVSCAEKMYPKLVKHYNWFRDTQRGFTEDYETIFEENGADTSSVDFDELYRWAGRSADHCLPSGLDDYPRADVIDIAELHVDTLAWVGGFARSMKQLATLLGHTDEAATFELHEKSVVRNLENFHWSEEHGSFCDVTINPDSEEIEHVCHQGYISLLPFSLKLLPKDSAKLNSVVDLMSDESKLFSPYGLLSLSKQDRYYGTKENYWRSPVWMNMNYLCLDALQYYFGDANYDEHRVDGEIRSGNEVSDEIKNLMMDNVVDKGLGAVKSKMKGLKNKAQKASAPNSQVVEDDDESLVEKAKSLYKRLRLNVIKNVHEVWETTGYVFENYNAEDGHGQGVKHFTGWTALIVNIMYKLPDEI